MSDNPMDRLPTFDRVSIRAVLVNEGEDPGSALSAAGILDPIAIPVVLGEELDLSGGILGDGISPNLTAVLETQKNDVSSSSRVQANPVRSPADPTQPSGSVTATLPAAFGMRPLAPIRQRGG